MILFPCEKIFYGPRAPHGALHPLGCYWGYYDDTLWKRRALHLKEVPPWHFSGSSLVGEHHTGMPPAPGPWNIYLIVLLMPLSLVKVRVTIHEILTSHESTTPFATNELEWFMVRTLTCICPYHSFYTKLNNLASDAWNQSLLVFIMSQQLNCCRPLL